MTAALLVAFMLLTFWGVMAQVNAEAAGLQATIAVERFFDSYVIWVLGVVPLPAFKSIAVLACVNLIASMVFRIPRGWKNAGLWLMHVALLVLLAGSVVGSEIKREYNGFAAVTSTKAQAENVKFFDANDSLGVAPIGESGRILENRWPYYVQYRGSVEMAPGKNIEMYKAFYDPFHFVPYAFMALFLLGAAFHYAVKVRMSRMSASRMDRMGAKIVPVLALAMCALPMDVRADEIPDDALVWFSIDGKTPVVADGVVRPFDSFARGFLDDLSGRVTYKCREKDFCEGKEPAVNIVGWIKDLPERTGNLALFKVLRSDVLEALRLPGNSRYVGYAELEPSRDLLELYASRDDNHPATSEMKRLYANVLQYEAVKNGTAFTVVEESSPESRKVDAKRLSMEVFYHKANFALVAFALAFAACLLASLNLIFKSRKLDVVSNVACMVSTLVLTSLFVVRTYVAARPPMSSLYEIVLLVVLLLMAFEAGAFFLCKRRTYTLMVPVTFTAVILLFFAKFVLEPGDTFRPIPAVLNSSVFLTLHVFTIALGFAGMILSGVVSHLVLFRGPAALPSAEMPKGSPLYSLMYGTLVFGAVFTIIGTLLGGVWADYAWGRFWGFDPKECGALFVILWAMLLLHLRAGRLVNVRTFALLNCFNVIVTFLCWFGVNLLGVGLHSYGFQGGTAAWLGAFIVADVLFIVLIERFVVKQTK